MTVIYKSLNGLDTTDAGELQNHHRITVLDAGELQNVAWGSLLETVRAPLLSRIESLETTGGGSAVPSIWPQARILTLRGPVSGSVSMDGSGDAIMSTSISDGALTMAHVSGLQTTIEELQIAGVNRWGTGYTNGPNPTSYGGDLNLLSGAVFIHTEAGTTNLPPADTGGNFTILHNGPMNFGQQMGLRNGELWLRGQHFGEWTDWAKSLTTRDVDLSTLLLKTDTATAATKLAAPRTFSLTGVVTATGVAFDGTSNVSLTTDIANGSLTLAKVKDLQGMLDDTLMRRSVLGTSDLNSFFGTGNYTQNLTANATTARGYPEAATGVLTAMMGRDYYCIQIYTTINNRQWRRVHNGTTWSKWTRIYGTDDFDPSTKFDKTGGTIDGSLNASGSLSALTVNAESYQLTAASYSDTSPRGVMDINRGVEMGGLRAGATFIELGQQSDMTWRGLRVYSDGRLAQVVGDTINQLYHTGNLDPSAPVPSTGVLTVGDPIGTKLLLRQDGKYSLDGGTQWRELNEGAGSNPNPNFNTLTVGTDTDIWLYEEGVGSGSLGLRTGNEVAHKYFYFLNDGNFHVANGRILVGPQGHEVWHSGTFNPTSKLDSTATAVAAEKLATPRMINGVPFDGTQNITLPTSLNPQEYVKVVQTADTFTEADSLGGKLAHAVNGGLAMGAPGPHMTTWNLGSNGNRDGQLSWTYGQSNELYFRSRHDVDGTWKSWRKVWTDGNFDPSTKLDYRASLDSTAQVVTDWNSANQNGWYMATGALNGPPGYLESGEWLIGKVSVHNSAWVQQEVWDFTQGAHVKRWRRHLMNGTWGTWTANVSFGQVVGEGAVDSAFVAKLPYGVQGGALALNWGEVSIWQIGAEANGDFKLWAYTDQGAYKGSPLTIKGDGLFALGDTPVGATHYDALSVAGGIKSKTAYASLGFVDQGDQSIEWNLVSTDGIMRFWRSNVGFVATLHSDGAFNASRVFSGYDSGVTGSVSASNWFRAAGDSGIYFADFGGGWHMTDTSYVRSYMGKAVTAGDFVISSDKRLKDEVEPLTHRGRLRPVYFRWKDTGVLDFGFMAQEVEQLYPEAVGEIKQIGGVLDGKIIKQLSYQKLTAVLAAQTNDNSDEIALLKHENQEQAETLRRLSGELTELRELIMGLRTQ